MKDFKNLFKCLFIFFIMLAVQCSNIAYAETTMSAETYFNRGLAKLELKDYYGAIADYTRAIELNPQYADAYNNRGYAKSNLKDYNGAIADMNEALRLDPDNGQVKYLKSLLMKVVK